MPSVADLLRQNATTTRTTGGQELAPFQAQTTALAAQTELVAPAAGHDQAGSTTPSDVPPTPADATDVARRIAVNRAAALARRLARLTPGPWTPVFAAPAAEAAAPAADAAAPAAEAAEVPPSIDEPEQVAAQTAIAPPQQSGEQRGENNTCLICRDELGTQEVQALECMHVYHKSCVNEFMRVTGKSFRQACPFRCDGARITNISIASDSDGEGAQTPAAVPSNAEGAQALATAPANQTEPARTNQPEIPAPRELVELAMQQM